MTLYKVVNTYTLAGLKEAERLHTTGWKTLRAGLFTTLFARTIRKKKRGNKNG